MSEWQPMDTAPKDGRWICVLQLNTMVGGGPWKALPWLMFIYRHRSLPESDGHWMSSAGHSVADSYISQALWSDIDALPLRALCERNEAQRRKHGGEPFDLPVPYGAGRPETSPSPAEGEN